MEKPQLTEEEIRALRDKVYDQTTTDKNWDGCKDRWIQPDETKWLREHEA